MTIRIHHKDMVYKESFVLSGLEQLIEEGITTEFLIDSFPSQLNRLRLEIDMEGLSSHIPTIGEHPLNIAAEYMMAEMLLPPFNLSKHGVPIHIPVEYAARASLSEADEYHPGFLDDSYSICGIIASSDEYAYAAYMLGFPHQVRVIEKATVEQIIALAKDNVYGLEFFSPDLVSKDMWLDIVLECPHYIEIMPSEYISKDYLEKLFTVNASAIIDFPEKSDITIMEYILGYGFTKDEYFNILLSQNNVAARHLKGLNENQILKLLESQKNSVDNSNSYPLIHMALKYHEQPISIVLMGLDITRSLKKSQHQFLAGLNIEQIRQLVELKSIDSDSIPNKFRHSLGYPIKSEDHDEYLPF